MFKLLYIIYMVLLFKKFYSISNAGEETCSSFATNNVDNRFNRFIYPVNIKEKRSNKFDVCVIIRLKNIGYLLPQWFEYHIIAGVEKFYVYDDCSDEPETMYWLNFYKYYNYVTYFKRHEHDCQNQSRIPNERGLWNGLAQVAKGNCRWVGAFDPDEYIFPVNDDDWINWKYKAFGFINRLFNIYDKDIMSSYGFMRRILRTYELEKIPVLRLPAKIVGSGGLEERPNSLIIDSYNRGKDDIHAKTIMLFKFIDVWYSSHNPVPVNITPENKIYNRFVNKYDDNMTFYEFANYPYIRQNERVPVSINSTCLMPKKSKLYLRHYFWLSYYDFVSIRGQRKYDSGGSVNVYAVNPRDFWLKEQNETKCSLINDGNFRLSMSRLVSIFAKVRLHDYRTKHNQVYNCAKDYEAWKNGSILPIYT